MGRTWVRGRRAIGAVLAAVALGVTLVGPPAQGEVAAPAECATAFPAYQRDAVAGATTVLSNQAITMSDGAVIRADVTLPAGLPGPFPVALTITGYGKSGPIATLGGGGLVTRGYATVMVDDRGTGSSGGTWDSWGPRTVADYDEVLDWIVAQPWSDGRIGLTGTSYMGITSLYAAATQHPAVKAVFATVPMADAYRDIVLAGGQVNTAFVPAWMGLVTGLGLVSGGSGDVIVDHVLGIGQFQLPLLASTALGGATAYDGPFWRQRSPIEVVDRIQAPTFIIGGLDDIFQRGDPLLYERLARHTDARLLIGPWTHATAGTDLPRHGIPAPGALLLQWFDQHVLGLDAGAECIPAVTQYVRGREHYESAPSWPVPGLTPERWHLRTDGTLTSDTPGAAEGGRTYAQLPLTGICTRSTSQWLIGVLEATPCATDNRLDEAIGTLTYTSAPMTTETVINGPIQADVWVTTTGTEASVSVAVSDVAPDGTSRGLTNGLLLASQRAVDPARSRLLDGQSIQPWHPFTEEAVLPVRPGEPMLLPIEVFPTSAALAPGHRLRVTIAPYDVPHALPPLPAALGSLAGTVTVLSDADHPSSIVLPVQNGAESSPPAAASLAATPAGTAGTGMDPAGDPAGVARAATGNSTGTDQAGAALATARGSLPRTGGAPPTLIAMAGIAVVLLTRRHRPSPD